MNWCFRLLDNRHMEAVTVQSILALTCIMEGPAYHPCSLLCCCLIILLPDIAEYVSPSQSPDTEHSVSHRQTH